ncbi:MAG: amidohydrolase family protein [Oscillospiraceae bacterium]
MRDLSGKDVFPGFIDAGNFLGTQDMAYFAKDYNENSSPITPYLDIWHSVDPDEVSLQELYKAGITSMVVTPGNEGLLGGTCAVIKTLGKNINKITVRRDVALKASFTGEVIRVFKGKGGPKTPMSMAQMLAEALAKTEYGDDFRSARTRQVMEAVKSGKMPILVACENACEIERFLDITSAYPDMKIIFTLSYEADRAAESIKKRGCAVVLGDTSRGSLQLAHNMDFAKLTSLAEDGVTFGLTVLGPDMSWGKEMLLWTASKLMRTCKDSELVVRMLTGNPAELFGVSDRIGLLKPGMDADYLIYDGNPVTQVGARLLETVIGGETVYCAEN